MFDTHLRDLKYNYISFESTSVPQYGLIEPLAWLRTLISKKFCFLRLFHLFAELWASLDLTLGSSRAERWSVSVGLSHCRKDEGSRLSVGGETFTVLDNLVLV